MTRVSRRAWVVVGAATASGLLLSAAAPAGGVGWLAWVALTPAASVTLRWPGTRAARLAVPLAYAIYLELELVPALPFGIATGQWGDLPPVMVGDSPVLLVALAAVPAFAAALYAIRFGEPWLADRLPPALGVPGQVVIPAAAFTALDFVRVQFDPGGLWGPLFLSQHGSDGAALAALGGPWLLSFAIAASGYAAALAVVEGLPALRGSRRRKTRAVAAAAAAALAFVALAAGAPGSAGERGRSLTVGVVQPGYDTAEEDRRETRHFEPGTWDLAALDTIRDLGSLSRRAARAGAEVVIWPEAALWVDPTTDRRVRAALQHLAEQTAAVILVPYFIPARDEGAALAVLPDGGLTSEQPKQRPMWFLGEGGAARRPAAPVPAGAARIGTMLGVDNQDPGVARRLAAAGANLITSSTHDWEELAVQQRAFASINARATATPVARSDWRHGSAVFDADGELVAGVEVEKQRAVRVARLDVPEGNTAYVNAGDVVGWGSLLLAAAAATSAAALRRRQRTRTLAATVP